MVLFEILLGFGDFLFVGANEELFDVCFSHLVFCVGDGGRRRFIVIYFGGFIFPAGVLVDGLEDVGEIGGEEVFSFIFRSTSILFPQHNDYIIFKGNFILFSSKKQEILFQERWFQY